MKPMLHQRIPLLTQSIMGTLVTKSSKCVCVYIYIYIYIFLQHSCSKTDILSNGIKVFADKTVPEHVQYQQQVSLTILKVEKAPAGTLRRINGNTDFTFCCENTHHESASCVLRPVGWTDGGCTDYSSPLSPPICPCFCCPEPLSQRLTGACSPQTQSWWGGPHLRASPAPTGPHRPPPAP